MPPPRPRPTITSLPQELLTQIALHLDLPSALSFAATSRHFASPAEQRIWQRLDLFLPQHYGKYPLVRVVDAPSGSQSRASKETAEDDKKRAILWEAGRAEKRHREALKVKVDSIMIAANRRRWGLVESIKLVPRPGANRGMVQILDFASASLRKLEIQGAPVEEYDEPWPWRDPDHHDTLDFMMVPAHIVFPALTHVRLGKGSVRYAGLITLLINITRSLLSLDIDLDRELLLKGETNVSHAFPDARRVPIITHLRLAFRNYEDSEETVGKVFESPYSIRSLLGLVSRTLRHLSISFPGSTGHALTLSGRIIGTIRKCDKLEDIYWGGDAQIFRQLYEVQGSRGRGPPPFPSLRRLAFLSGMEAMTQSWPTLPKLEILYFATPGDAHPLIHPASHTSLPTALRMTSLMASQLRTSPRLRAIHFAGDLSTPKVFSRMDKIEAAGVFTGCVNSYQHGASSDLLHIHLLSPYRELYDGSLSAASGINTPILTWLRYDAPDGSKREKLYEKRAELAWLHYTEFEGRTVPLEVIERMRAVAGRSEEEWQGRGIEVDGEAWKVLTDWKERSS